MANASKSSGMSDGTKIALALVGAAALGGIGYLIYKSTSAGSSTLTSGNQSTLLGPAGSSGALAPAAQIGGITAPLPTNQYEAGPGATDPLVATGV